MLTYDCLPSFESDLKHLTPEQCAAFRRVVRRAFVPDLRAGRFRAGLRVKRVQCAEGILELSWSMGAGPAGRATWEYGLARHPGSRHITWRRIGTHSILKRP
ncbi:hypothetical protein OHA46_33885 (plasmid) [Streptomyces sp. NBC_00708]